MAKRDDNAVIILLSVVLGILLPVLAFFLLRLMTIDAQLVHHKREVDKAIILLREERQKLKAEKESVE